MTMPYAVQQKKIVKKKNGFPNLICKLFDNMPLITPIEYLVDFSLIYQFEHQLGGVFEMLIENENYPIQWIKYNQKMNWLIRAHGSVLVCQPWIRVCVRVWCCTQALLALYLFWGIVYRKSNVVVISSSVLVRCKSVFVKGISAIGIKTNMSTL